MSQFWVNQLTNEQTIKRTNTDEIIGATGESGRAN